MSIALMARRLKRNPKTGAIAKAILEQYDCKNVEDMQDACLYMSIRKEMETKNLAVYVILGYDVNGIKDILGLWIGETEGNHHWMQIFDETKAWGVEDVLFISMDGVSGLEEGAKSVFKDVVVQPC